LIRQFTYTRFAIGIVRFASITAFCNSPYQLRFLITDSPYPHYVFVGDLHWFIGQALTSAARDVVHKTPPFSPNRLKNKVLLLKNGVLLESPNCQRQKTP